MAESTFNQIEKTFILFKPDSIKRGLVGKILNRFEEKGFKIVLIKQLELNIVKLRMHYQEHEGKYFFDRLIQFMHYNEDAHYYIAVVFERNNAVKVARDLVGAMKDGEYLPGTIRGDYSANTTFNLVHVSDSKESVARETNIWLGKTYE